MPRSFLILIATMIAVIGLAVAPAPASPETGHAGETGAAQVDAHGGDAGATDSPLAPPKQGLAPAITALVVFAIVMFILSTKVWPIITGGLDDRNSKIRDEIAAAEAAQHQARVALEEYEKSLSEARVEAQRMLDETRTEQGRLAAELKSKAERELGEMREKAKREIESAKKAAISELYSESVGLATQIAGKILQREVTVADQTRMLEESLSEMSKN